MVAIKVEKPASNTTPPPKKATTAKPDKEMTLSEKREYAVNGLFQLAGLGCVVMGQHADAGAISIHAPNIANEVTELASQNHQIANAVDKLLTVGPYAGLVGAVLPFFMQIAVNHGMIKADKLPADSDIVAPEVLEAQVKTAIARQQMEAMQRQREAERELAEMRAEWERITQEDAEYDRTNSE